MYGAWCFGDISRTADTLVLYRTVWGEHVCTVNVCDWLTGPLESERQRVERMDWRMVRGRYQCCCGLNGFSAGNVPLVFSKWQWRDGGAGWKFLPVLRGVGGLAGGRLKLWGFGFDQREKMVFWSVTQGQKQTLPPPSDCMTRGFCFVLFFFLVFFGAATKCAMCYVAWFIIFYKLQSSFVVQLYKLCA